MEKLIMNFRYWQSYKMYLNLMEKFVDKEISGAEFSDQFFQMWRSDRDRTYNLEELVYIAKYFKLTEIDGFSSLISDLFIDCDAFEAEPSLREDFDISEKELRNSAKKTLLEIKYRYL